MSVRRSTIADSPGAAGPVLAAMNDHPHWSDLGRCAEVDGEIFYPEKGGSAKQAKKVCARCEVRVECLEDALARDDRFGIHGGTTERERRKILRQRAARAAGDGVAA